MSSGGIIISQIETAERLQRNVQLEGSAANRHEGMLNCAQIDSPLTWGNAPIR